MDKETAIEKYYHNVTVSWTYARLTEQEKAKFKELIFSPRVKAGVKGTLSQRWNILDAIYYSFLMALDYKPIGWREEDTPLF